MNKEIGKCYNELVALQDKIGEISDELWRIMSNLIEISKGDNKVPKKKRCLYNGPHSKEAEFFIKQVEARLDKRPWTPSEEVSVMRAFAVTLCEYFSKEKNQC